MSDRPYDFIFLLVKVYCGFFLCFQVVLGPGDVNVLRFISKFLRKSLVAENRFWTPEKDFYKIKTDKKRGGKIAA